MGSVQIKSPSPNEDGQPPTPPMLRNENKKAYTYLG